MNDPFGSELQTRATRIFPQVDTIRIVLGILNAATRNDTYNSSPMKSETKETRENGLRINCIRRNTIIHKAEDYSYIPTDTRRPSIYSTNSVSSAIFHILILICISLDSLQPEASRQAAKASKDFIRNSKALLRWRRATTRKDTSICATHQTGNRTSSQPV